MSFVHFVSNDNFGVNADSNDSTKVANLKSFRITLFSMLVFSTFASHEYP
ncbi:MAG: hypothetical protein K1X82_08150 [Bacteroidia bacterium]|nr:hypothetical protein [Bacteroidia bacterium]